MFFTNQNSFIYKIPIDQWIPMLDELEEINKNRYLNWQIHSKGVIKRSGFLYHERTCFCSLCYSKIVKSEKHDIKWQFCRICKRNRYFLANHIFGIIEPNPMLIEQNIAYVSIWDYKKKQAVCLDASKIIVQHDKIDWMLHAWLEKMYNERPEV